MMVEFLANTVSGVHAVLIFYFLIGWLIPFADLKFRVFSNVILGGSFLLFRFSGACPLTSLEDYLRSMADPSFPGTSSYLGNFVASFGWGIESSLVNAGSLWILVSIFGITLIKSLQIYHSRI